MVRARHHDSPKLRVQAVIPGEIPRLANPGTIPLEIIDVQSGSYLAEGDIARLEDTYGRTSA